MTTPATFDLPVEHHFGGGVCIKSIRVSAGEVVVQHRHNYDHLSYLVHGTVDVAVDGVVSSHTGPCALTIEAGKHHGVRAVTDAIWLCIHATEVADPEHIDEVLVAPADMGEVHRVFEVLS